MPYPSLSELLTAYQAQAGGAGPAIAAGREGLIQGANLASIVEQRKELEEYRKNYLAERIKEAIEKQESSEKKVGIEAKKAAKTKYQIAPNVTSPEGKVAVLNTETGKVEYQDLPGAKTGKDVMGSYAGVRKTGFIQSGLQHIDSELNRNPLSKQGLNVIGAGRKVKALIARTGGSLTPQEFNELQSNIANMVSSIGASGRAPVSLFRELQVNTLPQAISKIEQTLVNKPIDAETRKFISRLNAAVDAEETAAHDQVMKVADFASTSIAPDFLDDPKVQAALHKKIQSLSDLATSQMPSITPIQPGTPGAAAPIIPGGLTQTQTTPSSTPVNTAEDFLKKHGI